MLSRKTWLAIGLALLVWAVWHGVGTVEVLYSVRRFDDGTVYESKIVCGNPAGIVFAGSFAPEVPGPATQEDCRSAARTRFLEVGLLALASGAAVFTGVKFGREPPRPIDQELPRLPGGERSVEGRRRRN